MLFVAFEWCDVTLQGKPFDSHELFRIYRRPNENNPFDLFDFFEVVIFSLLFLHLKNGRTINRPKLMTLPFLRIMGMVSTCLS